LGSKHIAVTILIFQGHVFASLVTHVSVTIRLAVGRLLSVVL